MTRSSAATLPNLTFPTVAFGELETHWDLQCLLYEGGAAAGRKQVAELIASGKLGAPLRTRIPLVVGIHDYIDSCLGKGGARSSAETTITRIREFFSWLDTNDKYVCLRTVGKSFDDWTDWLLHRQIVLKNISSIHAYQSAVAVAKVLDNVIGGGSRLMAKSRVYKRRGMSTVLSKEAEGLNLETTFKLGNALLDIVDTLSEETIKGPLPVIFRFRTGDVIEEWLRLRGESIKSFSESVRPSTRTKALEKRATYQNDGSLKTRFPLATLRVQSELLIFISQTGMNVEQAYKLQLGNFRYRSHLDGYYVYRIYKNRRHGEVEFEIFREYRVHLERYMRWRREFFPDSPLLFPFVGAGRAEHTAPGFAQVRKMCERLKIAFVGPRALRSVRVNWLLRSSRDPSMTAEMSAHGESVLLRTYAKPSRQIALAEIYRYHQRTDPFIECPGPGVCVNGLPKEIEGKPSEASNPDCISPAGCLFCTQNRDIDSLDHIWSLTSYRYLKTVELSRYRLKDPDKSRSPASEAIERVTLKLTAFASGSKLRCSWVEESLRRIEEEYYHPKWDGFIRLAEA